MHREEVKTELRQKIQAFFENEDEIERIPIENLKQVSNPCHHFITFGRWILQKSTWNPILDCQEYHSIIL